MAEPKSARSKSQIEQAAIARMLGKDRQGSDDAVDETGAIRLSQAAVPKVLPKSKRRDTVILSSSGSSKEDVLEEEYEDGGDQITGVEKLTFSIDRDVYLQHLRDLQTEHTQMVVKNGILQKRLSEYYKKRKLDHALKEVKNVDGGDMQEKYDRKLRAYEELKDKEDNEMAEIKANVEEGERLNEERHCDATKKFQDLQHLEKSTGTGLIYAKKGKPIPEKTVERLLHVQRRKTEQTAALRLRYIRARNAVSELEGTVRRLETLAPGLTVAHYNQLLIDNQNYNDKIEDRDDELATNRTKVTEHNQMLAHIREKMSHTDELIDSTECDLGDAEMDWLNARETLNMSKSNRDSLRIQLNMEHQKAGLLTRRDLLNDYEAAAEEMQELQREKASLEESIARGDRDLRAARITVRTSRDEAELFGMRAPRASLPPDDALPSQWTDC